MVSKISPPIDNSLWVVMSEKRKIMVVVTGASGIVYSLRLLQVLREIGHYIETIYTRESLEVSDLECIRREEFIEFLKRYSDAVYRDDMMSAPPSSSSYLADFYGFVVAPASMNTLAKVSHGITDNLATRVVSNALRLRKRTVFLIRETPLGVIELRNALAVAEAGGIILPASPGFYHNPTTVAELIDFVVGKILDLLEIRHSLYKRWEGVSRGRDLCQSIFSGAL